MMGPRHPEDALFIVAEADYRFYPEDCVGDWYAIVADPRRPALDENLKEIPPSGATPSPSPGDITDQPSPSPAAPIAEVATSKERKFMDWQQAQKSQDKSAEFSEEIRELVQCCNVAAKIGHGNLVWFGWCPSGKAKSLPSHGSHLMAVTRIGAQTLLEAMERNELKLGHWDLVVRDWLIKDNYQHPKKMGACFVWPATGFFQTHLSGCDPAMGERKAEWNQSYLQPGVAPRPGRDNERERWLAHWPADGKGGAQWLHQMKFYNSFNEWTTALPPAHRNADDYDWQVLLWNRYWVDKHMNWHGPQWAAENKGKGKGPRDRRTDWADNKWAQLVEDPDGYAWDATAGSYEELTRCAEQLVVDWNHWDWNGKHSQREWATRKKAIALYKKRLFQYDPQEEVATYVDLMFMG